jgi:MFS family permease
VSRLNGWTLLYVLFISIGLLVFLNFQQPYVLEVMLGIPRAEHGRVVAQMALVHELVLIGFVGPAGALADRVGRRKVLFTGYLILSVGYIAYPFATSVELLTAFRAIFALGAALVISTFTTVLTDYPQEQSRGKLIATGSILNALGLMLLAGLGGQVIKWLTADGMDPVAAGQAAIVGVGLIGVLCAIIVWTGLRGEKLVLEHEKIPFGQLIREGFGAARNPRVALAYLSAFISRGDNVVIGAYLSLWAQNAGIAAGLSAGDAQAKAGIMIAIVSVAPLPFAALFGVLNDRMGRVTGMVIAMTLSMTGYLAFGLLDSPLAGYAIPVGILMGIGQVLSVVAGQTLIGQEADPRITGSTLGVFNLFGSVGTLVSSVLGGYLFDLWTNGGPFLMMGIGSGIVLAYALYVRARHDVASPAAGTA